MTKGNCGLVESRGAFHLSTVRAASKGTKRDIPVPLAKEVCLGRSLFGQWPDLFIGKSS